MKIRAIVINLLKYVLRSDFVFVSETDTDKNVKFDKVKDLVKIAQSYY